MGRWTRVLRTELGWLAGVGLASGAAGWCEAAGLLALTEALAVGVETGRAPTDGLARAALFFAVRLGLEATEAVASARGFAGFEARSRRRLLAAFVGARWPTQEAVLRGELHAALGEGIVRRTGFVRALSQVVATSAAGLATFGSALAADATASLIMAGVLAVLAALGTFPRRAAVAASGRLRAGLAAHGEAAKTLARHVLAARALGVGAAAAEPVVADGAAAAAFRRRTNLWSQGAQILFLTGALGALLAWTAWRGAATTVAAQVLVLAAVRQAIRAQQSARRLDENTPFVWRQEELVARCLAEAEPMGGADVEGGVLRWQGLVAQRGERRLVLPDGQIAPGEVVGLAGPSGAGKTTLADLLLRIREPDAGALVWGGVSASDAAPGRWRRRVGWVPQDPDLARGTVAEAVRFGRAHDDDAVRWALEVAGLEVAQLGLDTPVGSRGRALSLGERLRVAVARAVLDRPALLVLDEPTQAADRAGVEGLVARLRGGPWALLVVSHDPLLLGACDRVIEVGR